MALGYNSGQPFGDPNQFTRSTSESELDRFNQWLRSQPYWQQVAAQNPQGDFTDQERAQIGQWLQGQGVKVPDHFIIDKGGNFNQTNRLDDIAKWSAIIGGTALGGFGLAGMGPLGFLGGAAPTAAGIEGSATALGAGGIPGMAAGLTAADLGGLGTAGVLGSTAISPIGGLATGTTSSLGSGGTAGMLSSGMAPSSLGKLTSGGSRGLIDDILGGNDGQSGSGDDTLANLGSIFGDYANDEARNRIARGNFAQQYDRTRLQGREDDRAQETDALKKLAQTSYISSGGAHPLPTQVNSGKLPDLGFGPAPASDAQKQGATSLQGTLQQRLSPEGQFQPVPFDSYAKAGIGENIGRYGNYITGGLEAANKAGWLGKAGKFIGGLF